MYDQFKTKAEGVGAEVHRLAAKKDAVGFILSFLKREGVADAPGSYAVWAKGALLEELAKEGLPELPGLSFDVNRDRASKARVGITQVDWAVADTGSLVQDQSAVEQRLASSLPEIHLALLPTASILPSKVALFSRINPGTSRYIAFITGPSRTADIERVLTIGVHGPQRLVIVFVDDMGGAR
jgi:L-lactate dehydrogenase complex protein LldG